MSFSYKSKKLIKKLVDARKIEKVEAKLKQKQEKRDKTDSKTSSGQSAYIYDSSQAATASQMINKKQEENESTNRSFDIMIENFDIAFGNKLVYLVIYVCLFN